MKTSIASSLLALLTAAASAAPQSSYAAVKRACTQNEIALATGIHLNIQGQYAEYNGTVAIEKIETGIQAANFTAFENAKGMLQSDIQAGMNIRLFNQQIAPKDSPANAGITKYAAAQETEKNLAANLVGTYVVDKSAIDSLKMDIMQGIQLNENNLKLATSECDFTLVFPPANEMGV